MHIRDYTSEAIKTSLLRNRPNDRLAYAILGLVSEVGEVCGKFAKLIRDDGMRLEQITGTLTTEQRTSISLELGDVLWLLNEVSESLDLPLEDIAKQNIEKLKERQTRQVIKGSGDNR